MPDKPRNLDPLAEKVLEALSSRRETGEIVLGGYFALQHYLDYRTTHDIDAWWRATSSPAAETAIGEAVQEVADAAALELRERRFGETISWELRREGKKVFSFQVAVRSIELDPPVVSPWPPILLETLHDNIGAKMNALVERGAARDFLDVARLCEAKLSTPAECWALWSRKNPGEFVDRAKSKVAFHLMVLQTHRPLDSIKDPSERANAGRTRKWFQTEFLG